MTSFVHSPQSGQIAVVILLIMVVLMTVGLSVVTRTTQEVFLSQQENESARVFNAAEAGLEVALSQDYSTGTPASDPNVNTGVPNTTVGYTIAAANSLETTVVQGEAATVDLTGVTGANANIVIQWGKNQVACAAASLLVTLYYDDNNGSGSTRAWHEAIAPSSCTRGDEFKDTTTSPINIDNYRQQYTFNVGTANIGANTRPLFMRLRPVYAGTQLRVTGGSLPVQQHVIRSTGSNDIGDERRIIEVQRTGLNPPSIMDYALYSRSAIVKP